jgi:Transposase
MMQHNGPADAGGSQWRGAAKAPEGGGEGRIVAQAVVPGAVVAEVARQHDLTPQQLSNWIKAAKEGRVMLPAPEPDGEFGEATDAAFVQVWLKRDGLWLSIQPLNRRGTIARLPFR